MKGKSGGKDFCGFALPGMFCFFAVVILPFVYGVYLTLTDWNGVSSVKNFVGPTNFLSVLKDSQFWTSLLLTFKYVIFVVIIVNIMAFAIAYLLTRGIKGQNFFRAGFFTPNLIGGLVLGYIWQFVFSRVFVGIGEATGWSLFEASWLSDPNLAFAALVLVSVWQLSGYMILIYVAGFMGLSQDVMEAASIDGASRLRKIWHISLPDILPTIVILFIMRIGSLMNVGFEKVLLMQNPVNMTTSDVISTFIYRNGIQKGQFSYSAAVGIFNSLINLILLVGANALSRKVTHSSLW